MLKIWSRTNSVNVKKILWCTDELGLAYEREDAGLQFGVVDEPWYRKMNPNGLVPTIEENGLILWESNATWAQAAHPPPAAREWMRSA